VATIIKGVDLSYWEVLSWVDPTFDYGWCWEYIDEPTLGFGKKIVAVRGGGGSEMYVYDVLSDSGFTWFRSAPWGVSSGAALMYCPLNKELYLLRGGGYADFAKLSLSTFSWTTLTSAPWTIGSNNTTTGPNISAVHPCKAIASVPTINYTDTGGTARTTDHYIFVIRGSGYSDFALYDITNNVWGVRASLPWTTNRGSLIWAPEWNSGKIICIRHESTRDWAVYDIATNTWTSYTYGGGVVGSITASTASPVYSKGYGGHLIIFPSRVSDAVYSSGALDIVNNIFIHGIVPRYWGDSSIRYPRKNTLLIVINNVPYIYHYAGYDRKATFARCPLYNLL